MRDALDGHFGDGEDGEDGEGKAGGRGYVDKEPNRLHKGIPQEMREMLNVAYTFTRDVNGLIKPKAETRVGNRFLAPLVWTRPEWESSNAVVECEDTIAVAVQIDGDESLSVEYAMVERCDRAVRNGKRVTKSTECALDIEDKSGLLYVTWFNAMLDGNKQPVRDSSGRLKFQLPLASCLGYKEPIEMETVITPVKMVRVVHANIHDNRRRPTHWVLTAEDEKVAQAELRKMQRGGVGRGGEAGPSSRGEGGSRKGKAGGANKSNDAAGGEGTGKQTKRQSRLPPGGGRKKNAKY